MLNATEKDLAEANEIAGRFTLEDTRRVCVVLFPVVGHVMTNTGIS